MKSTAIKIVLLAILPLLFAFNLNTKIKSLPIGKKAPMTEHKMKAVSGHDFSILDLKQENGILVIFSCNTCPFVKGNDEMDGWENRYNEIYESCKLQKIGMVIVNSNEAKRDLDDSFTEMQKHSRDKKYDAPYVMDKNHILADAFGASTTPHVFLFDNKLKLAYKGAIDDNVRSEKGVKQKWLEKAIINLGKGTKIDPSETRNSGCSIKRL